MKTLPPIRVHNQALSLWQSVVAQQALELVKAEASEEEKAKLTSAHIQDHPMIQATNVFVQKAFDEYGSDTVINHRRLVTDPEKDSVLAYLSELTFRTAHADLSVVEVFQKIKDKAKGNLEEIEDQIIEYEAAIEETLDEIANYEFYRKYSDMDPRFLGCEVDYKKYYKKYDGVLKYNDWKDHNNDLTYGVIKYKIPNDAKVAIIGDWGTGMSDAENLLMTLMNQQKPDVIIHLGDIYYSATPTEVYSNFADIITKVFNKTLGEGKRIPVFNIPGNHDYYCFGYGLYDMVKGLNSFNNDAVQKASYFCLKTEDEGWQFLGMDTGYGDANPANQFNPFYGGPKLHSSEVQWHQDKLDNFNGATIMLSHHQLFSHVSKINGQESTYSGYPNLNKYLLDPFQKYFGERITTWLWGHEHNQVLYNEHLYGLRKGRLIGASAFEEATKEDPYRIKYPNCPFNEEYKLGSENDFFNHGYAIIDFSVRETPTDQVQTSYYEYPSWGKNAPNPIPTKAHYMKNEHFGIKTSSSKKPINFDQEIYMNLEDGLDYISPNQSYLNTNYPEVAMNPVPMKIKNSNGSGTIKNGDKVYIYSNEGSLNNSNVITAASYHRALFYDSLGQNHQNWNIVKVYPGDDDTIYEDDPVYFKSTAYQGQYMCPLVETGFDGIWLTTDSNVKSRWFLKMA